MLDPYIKDRNAFGSVGPATGPALAYAPDQSSARFCCTEVGERALVPTRVQSSHTDTNGLSEIAHTIERFDRDCNFGHAAVVIA